MDPENPVQVLRRAYTYFEAGSQQEAIKGINSGTSLFIKKNKLDLKECEKLF